MAAHYWRYVLLFELFCAFALTAVLGGALSLSPLAVTLTALVAVLLMPGVLISGSFLATRSTTRGEMSFPQLLRAVFNESVAFAQASIAMSLEPRGPVTRLEASSTPQPAKPVLLVHGIVCNRGIWRPLLRALRAAGFGPIRAVNLEPLFADIDAHTAHVIGELRRLRRDCGGARVAIVAHSMGGLVARAALRDAGPDDISQIITIATPHHGTTLGRLLPVLPLRQMRRDSPWLAALNRAQEGHFPVPLTSIYSANDTLISPPRSAALAGARQCELQGFGHLSLLSARKLSDCLLAVLTRD